MTAWTGPTQVRERARRRWDDGSLPRDYVLGKPCPCLDIPVRGPTPREIGHDLARVRQWQGALIVGGHDGRVYDVSMRTIGGRAIGRTAIPDRVTVTTYDQWWRLLGVTAEVRCLDEVLTRTRLGHGQLVEWVARRPLRAIDLSPVWPALLAATDWLVAQSGHGRYLREVSAPGVDTKFIERHQGVLAELLDCRAGPQGSRTADRSRTFASRRGFREPQRLVHLRLDTSLGCLPNNIDEAALPLRHAAGLGVTPQRVFVIENQVTFLSVPVPRGEVVVWGHGFDAHRLGDLPWLRAAAEVRYWGDIDTHGFVILSSLRARVPHLESVLMDRATLLAHRDRWVPEPSPAHGELRALSPPEQRLYHDLVEGVYGPAVRLEQERVDWAHCLRALGDNRA
ncbi:MAG TPA: Wadjet anti-phage system protein JetD domain-containing protein [Dermatophilaceae bacterium]|nr:Wadjet anti-phage system protein JetD domain-containing protein [Dermatophilaceae bacterium]